MVFRFVTRAVIISLLSIVTSLGLTGQPLMGIKASARPAGDSIVVRWAPTSPIAWQLLNKHGYTIERITLVKDGIVLKDKQVVKLGDAIVKPKPENEWVKWIDQNDYVAIAAQAIFGETFDVVNKNNSEIAQIINTIKEQEARFSYALFAADVSSLAADLSALRFVDTQVERGERYMYRIIPLVPEPIALIDWGSVVTGLDEYVPLPQVYEPTVEVGDLRVSISWPFFSFQGTYIGYFLERSVDGGATFTRKNIVPYVPIIKDTDEPNTVLIQYDSIRENETVFYRIIGLSHFGELGPPSPAVSGTGVRKLETKAAKLMGTVNTGGLIELVWEFPKEKEIFIKGFDIERSEKQNGIFDIIGESIPPQKRNFIDTKPSSTNYYRIVVQSQNGDYTKSFPVLVQLEDSIPPASPAKIQFQISNNGSVKLNWTQNTEPDLLGYRIYRSNFKNSEFSQITSSPIVNSEFNDSINLYTLTEKVYYKIAAIDNRFNTSAFSETIEVIKPDNVPPVPAIFKTVQAKKGKILLEWTGSVSSDVTGHELFRKSINELDWLLLKEYVQKDSLIYEDSDLIEGQSYEYRLNSVDDAGLKSIPVFSGRIKAIPKDYPPIKMIDSQVDREKRSVTIKWKYAEKNISKYLIYRAIKGESLSLYTTISAKEQFFLDTKVISDHVYIYRIKAVFNSGTESPFSKEVEVKY